MSDLLLSIQGLSLSAGEKTVVEDLALDIETGQIMGLVGESGSGKTLTALSIPGLLPPGITKTAGAILLQSEKRSINLLKASESELNRIRGSRIAMIFQEPMTSLNPTMRCGEQALEPIAKQPGMNSSRAQEKILQLFDEVKLPDPKRIFSAWPHELSGGQRQRVMIAMALSANPDLLIADEPTTALDVTVQKEILELLLQLRSSYNLSILFITHDLMVINQVADKVCVMYRGSIVEKGDKKSIMDHPSEAYTKGLLACKPTLGNAPKRLPTIKDFMENTPPSDIKMVSSGKVVKQEVLLEVKDLSVTFSQKRKPFQAVKSVSFQVFRGETLGLVGESGCGKTTLGRTILQLINSSNGSVLFRDIPLNRLSSKELRKTRREIQIVFQDPYSSLNPRKTISSILSEPIRVHKLAAGKAATDNRVIELLEQVGLDAAALNLYPHQFSGGQRQRIGIARALACEPSFLILDESVSALDVSVQAQILNLLNDLKDKLDLTYIFISHDLTVVKYMSDRVLVMSEGRIVESGTSQKIYMQPENPYTKKLIESIP